MDGASSMGGEGIDANKFLIGKPEERKELGRHKRRWVVNIKIDLQEVNWRGMDGIDLAQSTDGWRNCVNVVIKLRVTVTFGEFLD
jgi:hypothetical protein